MKVAAGPEGGINTELVAALGKKIAKERDKIDLQLIGTAGPKASEQAIIDHDADLAILPSTIGKSPDWPVVAILRQNVMALIVPAPAAAKAAPDGGECCSGEGGQAREENQEREARQENRESRQSRSNGRRRQARKSDATRRATNWHRERERGERGFAQCRARALRRAPRQGADLADRSSRPRRRGPGRSGRRDLRGRTGDRPFDYRRGHGGNARRRGAELYRDRPGGGYRQAKSRLRLDRDRRRHLRRQSAGAGGQPQDPELPRISGGTEHVQPQRGHDAGARDLFLAACACRRNAGRSQNPGAVDRQGRRRPRASGCTRLPQRRREILLRSLWRPNLLRPADLSDLRLGDCRHRHLFPRHAPHPPLAAAAAYSRSRAQGARRDVARSDR